MDFFPPTNWCRISSTHSMVPEGVASPDPPERPGRFVAREKGNIDDLAEAQRITFHLAMGQCQNPLAFRFWRTFIPTGWWFLFIFEIIVFFIIVYFCFFLIILFIFLFIFVYFLDHLFFLFYFMSRSPFFILLLQSPIAGRINTVSHGFKPAMSYSSHGNPAT